jgi:hypothetical protein
MGLFTPSRVAPHRGGVLFPCTWTTSQLKPFAVMGALTLGKGLSGVTVTCWAIAPMTPTSSRAMATTTWWAWFPRAMRRR